MLLKFVLFFLVIMGVLGMFGKFRITGFLDRFKREKLPVKCKKCGARTIGSGPCLCKKE